jgi:hypothetical protein
MFIGAHPKRSRPYRISKCWGKGIGKWHFIAHLNQRGKPIAKDLLRIHKNERYMYDAARHEEKDPGTTSTKNA